MKAGILSSNTSSQVEKLYNAIPIKLLEFTKQGLIRWVNRGCTVSSRNILADANVYEAQFVTEKFQNKNPLFDTRIQILISDEDCFLLLHNNLISNAQVYRLRNYIIWVSHSDQPLIEHLKSVDQILTQLYQEATGISSMNSSDL